MSLNILISGGGIAGPALAFWLVRAGHAVTIVEQSATLRGGGQAVDFRGPALDVLEKMGVLDQVRAKATNMRAAILVDARGEEIVRMPTETVSGELEIPRGDLARILHDAVRDEVAYRFGVRVASLADAGEKVETVFTDGSTGSYDLVVGADGLHSGVRALVFGPESEFVTQLGRAFCFFDMENTLRLDHVGMAHETANGVVVQQGTDPDGPAQAMLWLVEHDLAEFDYRDAQKAKRLFVEKFAGGGWEIPRVLAALASTDQVYFDTLAQVRVPDYAKGRVVLIGDAAWCASPRSGMGTSLAIIGAYVLAHELRDAHGDHKSAFERYHRLLEPYVARCQKIALDGLRKDTPGSALGKAARRLALWSLRFGFVNRIAAQRSLKVARSFALPDYERTTSAG